MDVTQTTTAVTAMTAALALLGDGAPAPLAGRLAGLDVEEAERAADVLAAAGLIAECRPLRFTHPEVRALIYASLRPGERAIAHRRAVRVLLEAGAAPIAAPRPPGGVEPAGDPGVARAVLAAGRRAPHSRDPPGAPRL